MFCVYVWAESDYITFPILVECFDYILGLAKRSGQKHTNEALEMNAPCGTTTWS